jgi:ribosomal protein S27AE
MVFWEEVIMDWSKRNCPNCNSSAFIETISTESCPDCGYEFFYGGHGMSSGGNRIYEAMKIRQREEWLWDQHEAEVERMMGFDYYD